MIANSANAIAVSPDGLLRLVVRRTADDTVLGFDGFSWHTHSDILQATSRDRAADAVERWIADLVDGKLVIAVAKNGDNISDIWVTEDPKAVLRFSSPDEQVEFRLWDGTRISP